MSNILSYILQCETKVFVIMKINLIDFNAIKYKLLTDCM